MSKRNRPRTAAEAAHRQRRHEQRSLYNSPESKAARAKAGGAPAAAAKAPAKSAAKPTPPPASKS